MPLARAISSPSAKTSPCTKAIVRVTHKQFGDLAMQNTFPKLSDTPGEVRWTGPELGEHTDEVLTDVLGLSAGDIAKLRELGVV